MSDRGEENNLTDEDECLSTSTKRKSPKRARIIRKPRDPDVGYRKPPVAFRFKPRESGNPSGRPKGRKNEATMLKEILFQKIGLRYNGGIRKITVYEAVLRRFAEASLKGDIKPAAFLFARYAAANSNGQERPELTADDKSVIEAFAKDLLAKNDGAE